MWPDDDRLVPFPSGDGLDPDLAALDAELARAGREVADDTPRPSSGFERDLRMRLVGAPDAVGGGTWMPDGVLQPLAPRVGRPARMSRSGAQSFDRTRWGALTAIAAVVVLAVVTLDAPSFLARPLPSHVADAVGATLVRDGTRSDLTAGTVVREDDRIETAADGHATLAFGAGVTRLAASTTVVITILTDDAVGLDQAVGRAWHRVDPALGGYAVTTADVSWTASGTAFDLDRFADAVDGEIARLVAAEHDVAVAGPGLATTVSEGSVATISLGARTFGFGPLEASDFADPWLAANVARDVALGFDPGALESLVAETERTPTPPDVSSVTPAPVAEATQVPTPVATPVPTAAPTATPAPTPRATPKPTPRPSAKPTPTPTPTSTPQAELATLGLDVLACNGGFTIVEWSKAPADGFDHYQTIRSTSTSIGTIYPPKAPGVAPNKLYVTDRFTLGGVDAGLDPGTSYAYRTMSFTAGDEATAASAVKSVTAKGVKPLGALDAVVVGASVELDWTPYGGSAACVSWAKLVISTDDTTPGYLEGSAHVWASEVQGAASAVVEALDPGTYYLRLDVLRSTESGTYLVARTDVATVTIDP